MRSLTTLFLLIFTVAANAADDSRASYRPASAIPKAERQLFQNAIDATIPVHFPDQKCSGVFVGTTGELLTNLHCIEACLSACGETIVATEALPETNFARKRILPAAIGRTCALRFGVKTMDAKGTKLKMQDGTATLLHVFGPGWTSPREFLTMLALFNPETVKQLMQEGFEGSGDLVLVRLQSKATRMQSPACATLSSLPTNQLHDVIGLAYPLLARKTENPFDPMMALGTTMMWTEGQVTRDAHELEKLGQLSENVQVLPFMLPPGTLMSSADGEGGASGSPLFDRQGRVAGIVRSTWKQPGTSYIAWRTQAVDINFHRQEILRFLGANACPQNPSRVR